MSRSLHMGALAALFAMGAISAGSSIWDDPNPAPRRAQRMRPPEPTGPITDSTPESKRAKRRRLAKEPRR